MIEDEEYTSAASRDETQAMLSVHAAKVDSMNQSLTSLGLSPLRPRALSQRDKASYGERKCFELQQAVTQAM